MKTSEKLAFASSSLETIYSLIGCIYISWYMSIVYLYSYLTLIPKARLNVSGCKKNPPNYMGQTDRQTDKQRRDIFSFWHFIFPAANINASLTFFLSFPPPFAATHKHLYDNERVQYLSTWERRGWACPVPNAPIAVVSSILLLTMFMCPRSFHATDWTTTTFSTLL